VSTLVCHVHIILLFIVCFLWLSWAVIVLWVDTYKDPYSLFLNAVPCVLPYSIPTLSLSFHPNECIHCLLTSQCYWRCSMLVGMKLYCDRIMWVSVYSVSVFFMQYLSYILILHCLLKTQPMSIGEYGLVFITLITLPHKHVSASAGHVTYPLSS
jgi:hypothetical protein